ncbi:MAG: bifunctional tetrahydrofolate synthase/dihydrofolate synthase [Gammaproteobacteria bacterium]|nr:bifunctional tetrahydrofolate synthase/dihydrofolate synthase [Gammaproteobacteria bacterium]
MRFQTLDEWLDWQSTLHPAEIELGLERVSAVWHRLRADGLGSWIITLAGTNGKGSTARLLEAIYRQAGYRVGLYTSPHLIRYNERIRVDGAEVSDSALCDAFERVDRAREGTSLTYFEFGTLAALDQFTDQSLDLVILEVGLGGRLDAVNIVDPDIAIITTVDLDHTDWLGDTREQIGLEKAGIMRSGRPVILGDPDMPASVNQHAFEIGAECLQLGRDFRVEADATGFSWSGPHQQYHIRRMPSESADHQLRNAATALMAVDRLSEALPVAREAVLRAMESSRLKGRLQIVDNEIPLLLDVAHNPQAVRILCDSLPKMLPGKRIHAVFGLLSDKDVATIMEIISPRIASWYLVDTGSERGQSAAQLQARMAAAGVQRIVAGFASAVEALASARVGAQTGDAILVFGSFVIVGQVLETLEKSAHNELI